MNWAVVSQLAVDTWNAKLNRRVEHGFRHPIRESSMHTIGLSGMGEATNKRATCRATWRYFAYYTATCQTALMYMVFGYQPHKMQISYFLKTKRSENGTHILIKYKYFWGAWSKSRSCMRYWFPQHGVSDHACDHVATTELALYCRQMEYSYVLAAWRTNGGHKQIKSDPGDEIEYTYVSTKMSTRSIGMFERRRFCMGRRRWWLELY
jgi:hypothetical protein